MGLVILGDNKWDHTNFTVMQLMLCDHIWVVFDVAPYVAVTTSYDVPHKAYAIGAFEVSHDTKHASILLVSLKWNENSYRS